ncbi:MAG: hypothetical protein ONB11_12595 [candidate division KSB1 bacterium]|nr:hypothetical protein [candidate division KSB1 bacterium]MDZ7401079.1 hypothetical protein [candidate division KSB1 bacterium]
MRKNYLKVLGFCLSILGLAMLLSCQRGKEITRPEQPRPQGWIAMGLENLQVNRIKVIGDWVYACTRQNGLLRSPHNLAAEADWHYLGLANLRVDVGYQEGLTDIVSLEDTLIVSVRSGNFSPAVSGIYRSIDDGKTWIKSDSGFYTDQYYKGTANVIRLIQSSQNPRYLLAVCSGGPLVYLSQDFGRAWKLIFSIFSGITFYAAAFHPLSLNELWVGGNSNRGLPLLYNSTDQGTTWQEMLRWPYYPDVQDMVNDIVFNPYHGKPLYVCMNHFILTTTDAGQTWVKSDTLKTGLCNLDINPHNANELIACGSKNLYKSIDGGHNWTVLTQGPPDLFMINMAIDWDKRILYVNTCEFRLEISAGIFKLFF